MPQKSIDVLTDGQVIVTFTAHEAKELGLVAGKKYSMLFVGVKQGRSEFTFVESEHGACEVKKQ